MQKFRGLDPRTRTARWGLLSVALGIVLGGTAPRAVDALLSAMAAQHDSLPWYASRLLGFLAYLAIAGSVVYGLLLSTKLLDAVAHRPISFALHQDLASIGLGLAGIHGALLGLDRTVPFSLAQLAIPFASPFRPLWVGFGQVALLLMAAVVASFYLRRRIGQRAWRLLHFVTFAVFAGTTAHGVMSGTDSGTAAAWWMYVGATVSVVFLMTYRVVRSIGSRVGPARARAPVAVVPGARPAIVPAVPAVNRAGLRASEAE
jgi:predicted ferric reductase